MNKIQEKKQNVFNDRLKRSRNRTKTTAITDMRTIHIKNSEKNIRKKKFEHAFYTYKDDYNLETL